MSAAWRRIGALTAVPIASFALAVGPTAAAQSRPSAVPGTATATAEAYSFAVGLNGGIGGGGATLGLTRGLSNSDSRDDTSLAKGIALDLGLVSGFNRLPTAECPAITPLFDPATLPPIALAESGDPATATPRPTEVRFPGIPNPGDVAGIQDATAGPGPKAGARTETTSVEGPFVSATALHSETTTSVDPSGRRSSTSLVTAERIDIAGWVTIGKPRFAATSSSDGSSAATFTFDFVYFLGQYHTGAAGERALQDARNLVEGLFSGIGLKIDLPVATRTVRQNPSSDTTLLDAVELSPLRVRLSNIPIARDLLGPILQALGPDIDRSLETYLQDPCADQGLSNIVTIARGLLSGDGELGTTLGAVTASTSDRWVAPPPPTTTVPEATIAAPVAEGFGTDASVAGFSNSRSTGSSGPVGSTGSGGGFVSDPVPDTTVAVADESPPDERPEVAELAAGTGPVSKLVSSRGGRLLWAGGILLAVVVCMAIADRTVLARRRTA